MIPDAIASTYQSNSDQIQAPKKEKSKGLTKGVGQMKPLVESAVVVSQQSTVRNSQQKMIPTQTIALHKTPLQPKTMILHHGIQDFTIGEKGIHLLDDGGAGQRLTTTEFQDIAQETMRTRVVQVAKIEMIRRNSTKKPSNEHKKTFIKMGDNGEKQSMAIQQYKHEIQSIEEKMKNTQGRQTIIFNQATQQQTKNSYHKQIEPVFTVRQSLSNINISSNTRHQSPRNHNNFVQRDTTSYQSERSSMFAENNQQFKREFTPLHLDQTIQKSNNEQSGLPPRGIAFLSGVANLNLMENLNAAAQNSDKQTGKVHQFLELNLRMQNMSTLHESVFQKNQFLRTVDLRNNLIKELPNSLCSLSILWKLRIDYNLLEHLPPNIGKLERLEVLTASSNRLKNLPSSLYQLGDKLSMLQVNDNLIKRLPSQLCQLKKLKVLLLHNNKLRSLPTEIFHLKDVQEFSLEWFVYLIPPVGKVLKDERGQLIYRDFLKFSQLLHEMIPSTKELHFVHFIAYFNKCTTLEFLSSTNSYPKSRSLVHYLCLNGHLHLLKDLLSSIPPDGKLLSQPDSDGTTPLILAFKNKQTSLLTFLINALTIEKVNVPLWLRQSLDLNQVSTKYGSCLNLAVKNHDYKLIKLILQNVDKLNIDINTRDQDGNNALHMVMAYFGFDGKESAQIAVQLIRKGIDINALNKHEWSPLHAAIKAFQSKAVKFALDFNIHRLNKSPHKQIFDLNLRCGKSSWTALHYAVFNNNLTAVLLLLQYACTRTDPNEYLYLFSRDSEGRKPQDLCPYNSPLGKIIGKAQLDKILPFPTQKSYNSQFVENSPFLSPYQELQKKVTGDEQIEHLYINRRYMNQTSKIVEKSLKRANSNSVLTTQDIQQNLLLRNYHKNHQANNISRTDMKSGQQQRNLSVIVSSSRQQHELSTTHNNSQHAKQQSPRLFQKVPPLPPKRLLQFQILAESTIIQGDNLMDMEELIQQEKLKESELNIRFMSHQINFDTIQQFPEDMMNTFNVSEDDPPQLDLTAQSNSDLDSQNDSDELLDRPVNEYEDKALNLGTYYKSQRPKSYTEVQTSNNQCYQSAPITLNSSIAISRHDQEVFTPALNEVNLLMDDTAHQTFKPNLQNKLSESSNSENDDICDAADEEPEAGSLGQMIANKINKFENNQKVDIEQYKARIDRETMRRLIEDINEVKRLYKVQEIYATPTSSCKTIFKSRDVRSKATLAKRYGDDEEDEEGNVFDTVNQGPFVANQIPGSLTYQKITNQSECSTPVVNTGRVIPHVVLNINNSTQLYSDEEGSLYASQRNGQQRSLKQRNRDCIVVDPTKEKVSILSMKILSNSIPFHEQIRLLYQILSSLYNNPILLGELHHENLLTNLLRQALKKGDQIFLIAFFNLIAVTRSKVFIPILERLKSKVFLSEPRKSKFLFIYELENALDTLMVEAMVQSRKLMERENKEIKREMEKSRQKLKKISRSSTMMGKDKAEISDDEGAHTHVKSTQITQPAPSKNSSTILHQAFSIREVPEFVARLQKSPSASSLSRSHIHSSKNHNSSSMYNMIIENKSMSVLEQQPPPPYRIHPLMGNSSSSKQLIQPVPNQITPKASEEVFQAFPIKKNGPTSLSVFKNRAYSRFYQKPFPSGQMADQTFSKMISKLQNPFPKRSRSPDQEFIKLGLYFPTSQNQQKSSKVNNIVEVQQKQAQLSFYKKKMPSPSPQVIVANKTKSNLVRYQEQISPRFSKHNVNISAGIFATSRSTRK